MTAVICNDTRAESVPRKFALIVSANGYSIHSFFIINNYIGANVEVRNRGRKRCYQPLNSERHVLLVRRLTNTTLI